MPLTPEQIKQMDAIVGQPPARTKPPEASPTDWDPYQEIARIRNLRAKSQPPKEPSFFEKFVDPVASFGLQTLGSASESVGNLINFAEAPITGTGVLGEPLKGLGKNAKRIAQEQFGTPEDSMTSKAGEVSGEILASAAPIGATGKIVEKGVSLLPKIAPRFKGFLETLGVPLGFLAESGAATTTGTIMSRGETPTYYDLAAGGVIDGLTRGLSRMIGPERLITKAMGITPDQSRSLSNIASSTIDPKTGKPFYTSIEDFALKNNLSGSREQMLAQSREIFNRAKESKASLLKGIKETVPNEYDELFAYLLDTYNVPGQKKVLSELQKLSQKPLLTALELDRIRYLTDDSLPRGAYSGAEPVRVEGVQNLVDGIRGKLAELEPTGQLTKENLEKRLLQEMSATKESLTKALDQSSKKSVLGQTAFRGATMSGAAQGVGYGLSAVSPEIAATVKTLGTMATVIEAILSVPEIGSRIAQMNKSGKLTGFLEGLDATSKAAVLQLLESIETKE